MTPAKVVIVILGLAFGHWGYLGVVERIPSWQLWAAHKLVENDLNHGQRQNKDNMLLLCVKQLEDYERRIQVIVSEATYPGIVSTDLVQAELPKTKTSPRS